MTTNFMMYPSSQAPSLSGHGCGGQIGQAYALPRKDEIILDKAVDHPEYYSGKIECIDAMAAATENLNGLEAICTGIAIKYLWRWKKKNGVQDLKKCIWYINRMIEEIEKNNGGKEEGEQGKCRPGSNDRCN